MSKKILKQIITVAAFMFATTANAELMKVDFNINSGKGAGTLTFDSSKVNQPDPAADFSPSQLESFTMKYQSADGEVTIDRAGILWLVFTFNSSNVVTQFSLSASDGAYTMIERTGFFEGVSHGRTETLDLHYEFGLVSAVSTPPQGSVPEPATLSIFGLGLLGLAALRCKSLK